jgi:hypothetical protein
MMRRCTGRVLFGLLLSGAAAAGAQAVEVQTGGVRSEPAQQSASPDGWRVEMERRHDELVQNNGPGTDAALRDQLLSMLAQDRAARGLAGLGADGKKLEMASNLGEIDAALTEQLKAMVAAHGWPTISLVGIDASNAAMLILTHSKDHAWQLSLLPQLEQLTDGGKIDGSGLALVIDKELISEGKPQRYGSQFKLVDGGMAMFAVEDPGGLDGIRARVFLPPMNIYKKQLSDMYHFKVTNQIVRPTPPEQTRQP